MAAKKPSQITFVPKSPKEKLHIVKTAALRPDTIYVTSRDVAVPNGDFRKKTAPWYERGMVAKDTRLIAVQVKVEVDDHEIQIRPFERGALAIAPDHDLYYELLPTLEEAGPLRPADVLSTFPVGVTAEAVIEALVAAGSLSLIDLRGVASLVAEDLTRRGAEVA